MERHPHRKARPVRGHGAPLTQSERFFYLPKHSSAGQLLSVKDGVQQMLEQLDLTDEERAALEGDLDALTALAERLASVPTPAGPTPEQLGTDRAFIALTTLKDSLKGPKT